MTDKFPPIGAEGYALETFEDGEKGNVFITTPPEHLGEYEVIARGEIRERAHVIIIDGNRGCREGSPEEIKFLRNKTGRFYNADEDVPYPVRMSSRGILHATIIATALGATAIVPAPGAAKKIRVHYFSISNRHAAGVDVAMTYDATASVANLRHRHFLAALGGNVTVNLADASWDGGNNEGLFAWLVAAYAGGVIFNVAYTVEDF